MKSLPTSIPARCLPPVFGRAGRSLLVAGLMGLWAGCATGDFTYVVRTGTGQKLEFPLVKGAVPLAKADGVQILQAGLLPSPDTTQKKAVYVFAFAIDPGATVERVLVEDVSEDTNLVLVDDKSPKLTDHKWSTVSTAYDGNDAALSWLGQLGDTMRVYRFTITKANGQSVILHQGWLVPGWTKAGMRRTLGLPAL